MEGYNTYDLHLLNAVVNAEEDVSRVQELLEKGAHVNVQNRYGKTPFQLASESERWEIAKVLIQNGAEVIDVEDEDGKTPLHKTCYEGILDVSEMLVERGVNVNAQGKMRGTPLHWTCYKGHVEISEMLISNGADVNAQEGTGTTDFRRPYDFDDYFFGESDDEGCPPDNIRGTPLHWAICRGHFESTKLLVKNGANLNIEDICPPLHVSIDYGHWEISKLLIMNGADVNAIEEDERKTTLHMACDYNNFEVSKLLIQYGASVSPQDYEKKTPLHYASWRGNLDIVKLLMQNGAVVNARDDGRGTILHLHFGDYDEDGNWEAYDHLETKNDGYTPLHLAFEFDRWDTAKVLIEGGADVNAKYDGKKTALHHACLNYRQWDRDSQLVKIKFLIENGADLNATDESGDTPLHIACGDGDLEICKLLIANGASFDAYNNDGKTPFHVACESRYRLDVVWFVLRQYPQLVVANY